MKLVSGKRKANLYLFFICAVLLLTAHGACSNSTSDTIDVSLCSDLSLSGFPMRNSIAFDSIYNGQREIFIMDTDGSDQIRATDSQYGASDPLWSPYGSRLAFNSNGGIYVIDKNGLTTITDNGMEYTWSPDSTRIAFVRINGIFSDIYSVNVDGSNLTKLTSNIIARYPTWSPDGSQIAFEENSYEISVMDADGSNLTDLTDHSADFNYYIWAPSRAQFKHPVWSPDGSKVAFLSDPHEIWVINADGTNQTKIFTTDADGCCDIVWSPDSEQIAFANWEYKFEGGSVNWNSDLYLVDADGSDLIQLTENETDDRHPTWSPDGSDIAFVSDRGGNYDIYLISATGANERRLTETLTDEFALTWSFQPQTNFAQIVCRLTACFSQQITPSRTESAC